MKRATFITWEQLKVGVVILIALAILVFGVFTLGRAANLFTDRYELVALLPSVNGLRIGGSVAVAGQISGTVKDIEFLEPDNDTTQNIVVTFEVDKTLQAQIREDSEARLRTLGLLGDKFIDISPGTPQFAVLREGDTIAVSPSLDYEEIIARAADAVDDMVQLTADLKEISGGLVRGEGTIGQLLSNRTLYDELTSALTRMNSLMASLQNPNGTFGRLLEDPTLYNNMTEVVASMDSLLAAVNNSEGSFRKFVSDTTLYANIVDMAQSADSILTLMSEGEGFAARMLHDQELYDKLNKLVTDLNAILEEVRANPEKYMEGIIKVF